MANNNRPVSSSDLRTAISGAHIDLNTKVKRPEDSSRSGSQAYSDASDGNMAYTALGHMAEGYAASKKTGEILEVKGDQVLLPADLTALSAEVKRVLDSRTVYVREYTDGGPSVVEYGELGLDLTQLTKNNSLGQSSPNALIESAGRNLLKIVEESVPPPSPTSVITALNQIRTAMGLAGGGATKVDTKQVTLGEAPMMAVSPYILLNRKEQGMKPVIVIGPHEQVQACLAIIDTSNRALIEAYSAPESGRALGEVIKVYGPFVKNAMETLAAYGRVPEGERGENATSLVGAFLSMVPKLSDAKVQETITAWEAVNSEAPCRTLLKEGKAEPTQQSTSSKKDDEDPAGALSRWKK